MSFLESSHETAASAAARSSICERSAPSGALPPKSSKSAISAISVCLP